MRDENNCIKYFMWGFQDTTQRTFQTTIEKLLSKFSKELFPKLFFIGVLEGDSENEYKICLEPENCGYKVSDFDQINEIAAHYETNDPEKHLHHTLPYLEEKHKNILKFNAYKKALKTILKKQSIDQTRKFFISYPTKIGNYLVFTILSINNDEFKRLYSLNTTNFYGRYPISNSFLSAVVDIFSHECNIALNNPEEAFEILERYSDQIFKKAGKKLLNSISYLTKNEYMGNDLFDSCNEIAALKYEGAEGIGNMILAKKDHENIKYLLRLSDPIKFNEHRKVRKFLELSANHFDIISDTEKIYGLGTTKGQYNPANENLFYIKFLDHHKWELSHNRYPMLRVNYSEPSYPNERINKRKFASDLDRIFGGIQNEFKEDLWDVIITATEQKHGTMVVISENAAEEAERLNRQCFKIESKKIDSTMIKQITNIDGAVLIDKYSICHAIGVILDGTATKKGDSSRGARYNSAIRYYEANKEKHALMIIVISEDGMIDIIPDLLPKIKHSKILKKIDEFKELKKKNESGEKINPDNYYELMKFFNDSRFYLNDMECIKVNEYMKNITSNLNLTYGNFLFIYKDFSPSPEMNDSYYEENDTEK